MKSLFLNTSNQKLIVSIIIDNEIKYEYKDINNNELSTNLMPIVDEAFKQTNIKPNDIDTIFVTNGPGSFTGIRIGLTVAKVIAWSLKIKVVPISTLELMASTSSSKDFIAPLIDARRGYVFCALYDKDLNNVINDSYMKLDDFMNKIDKDNVVFISHDDLDLDVSDSDYDIMKVITKHLNDEGINPHLLNPNYLKLTEAEEKLNGK